MSATSSPAGSSSPSAPKSHGFDAVPCGVLDLASNEKLALVTRSLVVPSRLDVDHMRATFYRLLGEWPYLAGRLRKGAEHKELWEVHVPRQSTLEDLIETDRRGTFRSKTDVPLFSASDEAARSVEEALPVVRVARRRQGPRKPSDRNKDGEQEVVDDDAPVLLAIDRKALLKVATSPRGFTSTSQCFERDGPIFSMHVANYADGAVVSCTWPHVCFDAIGYRAVLDAYTALLRGEAMPFRPLPLGYDPFKVFVPSKPQESKGGTSREPESSPPTPPTPAGWRILSLVNLLVLAFYVGLDVLWHRPERKMQRVVVYLPPKAVERIKEQARADIEREGLQDPADGPSRVSTSGALHAWIIKNDLARRVDVAPKRLTTHATLANMRFRLPSGLASIESRYPGNCLMPVGADPLPAHELASHSIGRIAHDLRQTLTQKASPAKLEQYVRWQVWRSTPRSEGGGHRAGSMAVFFPPKAQFTVVTDWSKVELFDIDFDGAVLRGGAGDASDGGSDEKDSKVLVVLVDAHTALHHRNAWTIAGGRDGSQWLLGYISDDERNHPNGWGRVQDAVV